MNKTRKVSYQPTAGLSYDPQEGAYWEAEALGAELARVFEVCSGCRMCFKYCDSFPTLFDLIDEKHDGDVSALSDADSARVMGGCFQCKLCEVQCPYTPREGHEFKLDFPRLVHRYRAQRVRREGSSARDRLLGDPDRAGRAARWTLGLANRLNRVRIHRVLMEKVVGIHRDKQLPDFAAATFESWADSRSLCTGPAGREAVLFQTCYVQHNDPAIGRDTTEVLRRNGVDFACAKGLKCCGMPAWEHGDIETLRENARRNLDVLMPFVENGAVVLVINPTCSMMLRREWPELLEGEDRRRAQRFSVAVRDVSEYLWSLRKQDRFNTRFRSSPGGKVSYHVPCHLRAQAVGFPGRDLLGKIPGVTAALTMECCGHNGTYAMSVDGFEASQRIGKKAFDSMRGAGGDVWATDCPLAALQFAQHAGMLAIHPMTILARAYRADGFSTPVESGSNKD